MDQAIIELVGDLEKKVRQYQKRFVEHQTAAKDLNEKIHKLETTIERLKEEDKC